MFFNIMRRVLLLLVGLMLLSGLTFGLQVSVAQNTNDTSEGDNVQKDLAEENNPAVSINISNPIYVSKGKCKRIIEINITNYNISKIDSFDLININGSEYLPEFGYPLLPMISVPILLPKDSNIGDVNMVSNVSSMIGHYNIPCINESGYTSCNITGTFPSPIYVYDVSEFDEYKKLRVNLALVQYNPQTNETILNNYTKLELTYQTPITLAVTDFSSDKTEYVTGETINTSLTVENVGSDALTGLRANLSLKDSHGIVKASSLSAPFDVASGKSKTVYTTLSQNLPHRSYLAEMNVKSSTGDVVGSSSNYIHIKSGGIVDSSLPSEGDNVNETGSETSKVKERTQERMEEVRQRMERNQQNASKVKKRMEEVRQRMEKNQERSNDILEKVEERVKERTQERMEEIRQKMERNQERFNETLENLSEKDKEVHRHGFRVSNAVHSLLATENWTGGIGEEVSQIAQDINKSVNKTVEAEQKINNRGGFSKFLFGGDEKAAEKIQSQVNKNQQRLQRLEQSQQNCNCSEEVKNMMQEQIQEIEQEQQRLQQIAQEEKQNKGLLGWLWK